MKKVITYLEQFLEHPVTQLFIAIDLIVIGLEQLYKDNIFNTSLHWKHGMGFYGLLIFIQAMLKIVKGSVKLCKNNWGKT